MKKDAIHGFIDGLQAQGQYYFLKRQLLEETGQDEKVENRSLARLQAKNRILLVRRGFYVIVPLEFSRTGILPPVLAKGYPRAEDFKALDGLAEAIAAKHRGLNLT